MPQAKPLQYNSGGYNAGNTGGYNSGNSGGYNAGNSMGGYNNGPYNGPYGRSLLNQESNNVNIHI